VTKHHLTGSSKKQARPHDCSYIAVGRLTHIHDRMDNENDYIKRQLHNWAFREVQEMVVYKAAEYGINLEDVNPAFSSQTCSKCGHQSSMNRDSNGWSSCNECGYELDGDYNAVARLRPVGSKEHWQAATNCTRGRTPLGVRRQSTHPVIQDAKRELHTRLPIAVGRLGVHEQAPSSDTIVSKLLVGG